jgi:4-amino-4-deoxy-L-arabinose transferase-like glycosyltransferase
VPEYTGWQAAGAARREGLRTLPALAAVLALLLFGYPLAVDFPLLDPAEGLHAAIAQQMVESGDWITPRFLGRPFLDKPILYFWAEALSLRVFGMHEAAVRLPGLMLGLLGAVTTGIVGWRMFGRTVGLVGGIFYATTILPTALAQAAAHDVALVPLLNLALLLFWESDRTALRPLPEDAAFLAAVPAAAKRSAVPPPLAAYRLPPTAYYLAAGLLLGLAVLTKGLVGVAVVGVAYGGYVLIARRLSLATCIGGAAALAVAAAVAAPWYAAMEIRNPGYLHYFFLERHVLGFATASQMHGGEPWWYYLPILLGGGLPWIAYLPVTIQDAWRRRRQPDASDAAGASTGPMTLLWCWLIGGTLFLSTAGSKAVTYLWPVFPAVAILAAVPWARLLEGTLTAAARRSLARTFFLSSLGGPVVPAAALLVAQSAFAVRCPAYVWTATILVGLAAWLPPIFWLSRRWHATLWLSTLSVAAQFLVIISLVIPQVAESASARDLARYFNQLGQLPERLLIAEGRIGSLVFYLDRDLRAGLQQGQLQQVQMARLPRPEPGTVVALPERMVRQAARYVELSGVAYQPAGCYRLYAAADLQVRLAAGNCQSTVRQ